jgi:hypothetical protein
VTLEEARAALAVDDHKFQGVVTKLRTTRGSQFALDVMSEAADRIETLTAALRDLIEPPTDEEFFDRQASAIIQERHGVDPTDDEREALFYVINLALEDWRWDSVAPEMSAAQYVTPLILAAGFRRQGPASGAEREALTDENLWDFANDLLDAWNIEDTNAPSLIEDFRDRFIARFRRQGPITNAQVEAACATWDPYFRGEIHSQRMRAALEAARDAS